MSRRRMSLTGGIRITSSNGSVLYTTLVSVRFITEGAAAVELVATTASGTLSFQVLHIWVNVTFNRGLCINQSNLHPLGS